MTDYTLKNFVSAIKEKTVGAMQIWLSSQEGTTALQKFVDTQLETLDKLGEVQRVINLIIVSSYLQNNGVLLAPYDKAPWLLFLSCDTKAWASFENNYYEYYIQCSSILV